MHGETGLQMGQTPNISVNQDNNLQKMKRSRCCGGGAMVESEPVASGVRWPKSNWEILVYKRFNLFHRLRTRNLRKSASMLNDTILFERIIPVYATHTAFISLVFDEQGQSFNK